MNGQYFGRWTTDKPTEKGYYFALENLDPLDADVLLVFVELDFSVWYGKLRFDMDDFKAWFWLHIDYPEYPGE